MSMADTVANIAARFSAKMGGPYHPAKIASIAAPALDDGGSIAAPVAPVSRDAMVQVDAATEAMRREVGYVDKDVRLIVIGLVGDLTVGMRVEVLVGDQAGIYAVQSAERDPVGVGWIARGRPA